MLAGGCEFNLQGAEVGEVVVVVVGGEGGTEGGREGGGRSNFVFADHCPCSAF